MYVYIILFNALSLFQVHCSYLYKDSLVSCSCIIHQLHLYREVRTPDYHNKCPGHNEAI